MRISDHLKKEYWRRRVNPDADIPKRCAFGTQYYIDTHLTDVAGKYMLLTQEDFAREVEPSAHEINSRYMSRRPIYDVRDKKDDEGNVVKDKNGNPIPEWYVVGFDDLETVRYGWQLRIDLSKSAYMGGGGLWICHESKNHEDGEILNSWKDTVGLNMAWQELVKSCFLTGDGAIYLYQMGNTLNYEVFSYLKGDILFPDYDENRNPVLYRLYSLRGRMAVDIYACGYIETWVQDNGDDNRKKEGISWWNRISGWFAKGLDWNSAVKSDDGWKRLSRKETQISSDLNQCVYFRVPDCPHGTAQMEVESLEKASSFVAEGVKSTSQPVLFVKATNIDTLPAQDSHGKTIGVRGSIDELAHADAKYLGVPDLSNIATIDLANKKESILRSTLSTEITPDIFKSGADSSAAMLLLFTDEIIWAKNEMVHFYQDLKYLVEIFKALVAKIEGRGTIATMRTSCGVDLYIPRNETERLKMELDQVYSKTKSRKAAMADIGNSHPEDYEQIRREWEDELNMKSRIPAEAKAEIERKYGMQTEPTNESGDDDEANPNKPKVDNNAKGKTLLDD